MTVQQLLITRSDVQLMLGGISRVTFYKWRKKWEQEGRPFPDPVPNLSAVRGGALYRKSDVLNFFASVGIIN